jgi:hypothetical protein
MHSAFEAAQHVIELTFHHPAGASLAKTCADLTRQVIDMVSRE